MAKHTSQIVPPYDFSEALALPIATRFERALQTARALVVDNSYQDISDFPCVPTTGASETELRDLESHLGVGLPVEYRQFLSRFRYLKIDDGCEVGGFDHHGIYVTERPWVSNEHRPQVPYLVFANYWRYADGDQLMFDLSEPTNGVVAYLHEHGPLFEKYAPSFSLALWRLVHESGDGA